MNLTMRSINCHSSFLPLQSQFQFKQNQQMKASKMLWLSRNETNKVLDRQQISSQPPLRTKAISSTFLLGVTSPNKPDAGVFVLTSAGLFFLYWITNFVVPEMVSKYLQLEPTSDDQKANNSNTSMEKVKAEKPLNSTNMLPKKRGFNSTKPK